MVTIKQKSKWNVRKTLPEKKKDTGEESENLNTDFKNSLNWNTRREYRIIVTIDRTFDICETIIVYISRLDSEKEKERLEQEK